MSQLIIWSKDRTCQLDLLLDSIYLCVPDFFQSINVIFNSSSVDFRRGYNIVSDTYPSVKFYNDKYDGIEKITKTLVNNHKGFNTFFSTDDTVVYRQNLGGLPCINYGECLSLRLGLNTIVQNCHTGELQPPLNNYIKNNNLISWNPHRYHPTANYGYCFGLDMCGYNNIQLQNIFKQINFKTTNELESRLFKFRDSITVMRSYEQSIAVNVPLNNISGVTESMKNMPTLEELNTAFLAGKRIQLSSIIKSYIKGAHQEINLQLC